MRRPEGWRVWEAVKALALCHNVTPVYDNKTNEVESKRGSPSKRIEIESEKEEVTYQASSPDEIALVKWTEQVNFHSTPSTKIVSFAQHLLYFPSDWTGIGG